MLKSSSKNFTCKGTLRQVFLCLSATPFPFIGFCLGWSSNFVGSESGQIQSVKLLENMVSNRTPNPVPPYSILIHKGNGGGGRVEPGRGATLESTDNKAGLKIPTCLNVNSINTCLPLQINFYGDDILH